MMLEMAQTAGLSVEMNEDIYRSIPVDV